MVGVPTVRFNFVPLYAVMLVGPLSVHLSLLSAASSARMGPCSMLWVFLGAFWISHHRSTNSFGVKASPCALVCSCVPTVVQNFLASLMIGAAAAK